MVLEEGDQVKKYSGGLLDNIQGNVITAKPTRLQDAIRIANNLMDQKLKGYAIKNAKNKRRTAKTRQEIRLKTITLKQELKKFGGGGADPDSNIVTGTFLLNNRYATMLFDSGADRSFVSTTFSTLLDVIPSTFDTSYVVKLANGRILETNVILRGCTLGLLGYPFDIDLMPIELGVSYYIMIGD
nr:reverse transcriptase domain-containing protein [Tanacetum cinerariifolium]